MKAIFVLAAMMFAQSAMADTTLFKCVVPSAKNAVTLEVVKGDDLSADFVTVTISKGGASLGEFYSQGDKDSVAGQIAAGYLNLLVLTDATAQPDGVITNSGFLALGQDPAGTFSGFLAAQSNIYPLSCTK